MMVALQYFGVQQEINIILTILMIILIRIISIKYKLSLPSINVKPSKLK